MDTVLFFVSSDRHSCRDRLEGIYRRTSDLKWHVQVIERAFHKVDVRETLKFWNPDGIIAECGSGAEEINPRAFGKLPVVYFDRDPKQCRSGHLAAQLLGRMMTSRSVKPGIHTFGAPCVIRRKSTRWSVRGLPRRMGVVMIG